MNHFHASTSHPPASYQQLPPTIKYIGVEDRITDLFEGQYPIPEGISYNSYLIFDEKTVVMDTVDVQFTAEWLAKIKKALPTQAPDFLIVQHMEPDHSASICQFMKEYPETTLVASAKAFTMLKQFFNEDFQERRLVVKEGDRLSLGTHSLLFYEAPMVHWPEVIMTYEEKTKTFFSADAFGTFGTQGKTKNFWADEASRYYFGIVGKYGPQVQNLLKKVALSEIAFICPLHGPVLTQNLSYYMDLYQTWSSYRPEKKGIVIAYTSMYGNTSKAVKTLAGYLEEGFFAASEIASTDSPKVHLWDLARSDITKVVAESFRYDTLILATPTYNGGIFPCMRDFIQHLTERNFQNRQIAFIENGSWAPNAIKTMQKMLENSKNLIFFENNVTIKSALTEENLQQLKSLADRISSTVP